MGKDRTEKIVLLTTSIFVQMSNVQQWLCLFCILHPWINLDTCRGSGTLVGGGGGDTLAGTTLETTLAGTGAGQRDVCRTRRTVLPHWQHSGSTHTHGVIADTTAVHTLSTLTVWHLDAPGSMLTLTTLLPHTDGWFSILLLCNTLRGQMVQGCVTWTAKKNPSLLSKRRVSTKKR